MSYLLDTNVISELVRPKPNNKVLKWFDNIPNDALHISVLTLGEIRKGVEKIREAKRKEKLRLRFEDRMLPIDQQVADLWGRLQQQAKRPLPAIDSLLAATALHYELRLVTKNAPDFQFPALQILNPWNLMLFY